MDTASILLLSPPRPLSTRPIPLPKFLPSGVPQYSSNVVRAAERKTIGSAQTIRRGWREEQGVRAAEVEGCPPDGSNNGHK